MSLKLSDAAPTRIRTSPGPGSGTATSTTASTSPGSPLRVTCTAGIVVMSVLPGSVVSGYIALWRTGRGA